LLAAIISSRSSRGSALTGTTLGSTSAPEELRLNGLRRALFAGYGHQRVGTGWSQGSEQPCDNQHNVVLTRKIEERAQ
jgi:hypothetical protein